MRMPPKSTRLVDRSLTKLIRLEADLATLPERAKDGAIDSSTLSMGRSCSLPGRSFAGALDGAIRVVPFRGHMIIDMHAHALDEAFLRDLCRTPRFGLSADRDTAGRFRVRRGEAVVSLD